MAGARVRTDQASIGGNLTCDGCVLERLILTPVGGNVKLVGAPDGAFIFFSGIGGSLEIVESEGSTFVFLVSSSTIGGNVQIVKSGEHRLLENQVAGNVQVVENTGSFSTEIARNTIDGTLQCQKNVPPPIGGDNVVGKKEGQCASL